MAADPQVGNDPDTAAVPDEGEAVEPKRKLAELALARINVRFRAREDRFILLEGDSGLSPRLHVYANCKASRADCKAAEDPAGNGWAYEADLCCTDVGDGPNAPFRLGCVELC